MSDYWLLAHGGRTGCARSPTPPILVSEPQSLPTVVTMHHTVLSIALASADSPSQSEWWQTATGIIGIPVAILTLTGTWFLISKTRLESKKLQLEIREKERDLADAREADDPIKAAEIVVEPTFQVRASQDIILRAVLLVIILYIWKFIQVVFWPSWPGPGDPWPVVPRHSDSVVLDNPRRNGMANFVDTLQALSINMPRFLQGRTFRWLIVLLTAFLIIVHLQRQLSFADLFSRLHPYRRKSVRFEQLGH